MVTTTRESFAGSGRLPEGLIYPELAATSMIETLNQNTNAFNSQSKNTIIMRSESLVGDFAQESFLGIVDNLVQRRQVDVSPANPPVFSREIPADEFISVKLNRRLGPVEYTLDAARKRGHGPEVFAAALGIQSAKAMMVDFIDSGLTAATTALLNQTALFLDRSTVLLDTNDLFDARALFGDQSGRIKCWVMHSTVYHQFTKAQYGENVQGVADVNVATGQPITLNVPVLVVDSPALISSTSPLQYYTLGLVERGIEVINSEPEFVYTERQTGRENIYDVWQGEHAYNMKLKGFKWDTANGGVNPDDTALGTGTNWDKAATASKDLAGVVISSLG